MAAQDQSLNSRTYQTDILKTNKQTKYLDYVNNVLNLLDNYCLVVLA